MATHSELEKHLIIRPYEDDDRVPIIRLFEKVFRHPMGKTESLSHWVWEYENGPCGPASVFVCEAAGKIVGAQGNLPLLMKVGNRDEIVSVSFDSMVDTDYRGKGIFTRLVKEFYRSVHSSDICFSYNFPNENSHGIYVNKLGRVDIDKPIVLYASPLGKRGLLQASGIAVLLQIIRAIAHAYFQGGRMAEIDEFDARFDDLWHVAKKEIKIGLVRNRAYLDWRFSQKPEEHHRVFVYEEGEAISGYVILKMQGDTTCGAGLIMDLLALPEREDVVRALFARAFLYFISNQVGEVRYMTLEQAPYTRVAKSMLPLCRRATLPFCIKVYGGVETEFVLNASNWYISFADTDFF